MENYLDPIKNILSASNKNRIAVIGKGSSVKDINLELLNDFFVINVNDSELYYPGNLSLFYRNDKLASIRENGYKAEYYLAPDFLKIPDHKHVEVHHESFGQESIEHIYEYLESPDFYLIDFIIISAVKLALLYQKLKGADIEVYFLGFDFHTDQVKPQDIQMHHDLDYVNATLKTQESFFTYLLRNTAELNQSLQLFHIGSKQYSHYSVEAFNKLIIDSKQKKILKTNTELYTKLLEEAQKSNKTLVVAEFTNNHIADKRRLLKMIELAKESGADMIKLQKRDVDNFYTKEELERPYTSPFGSTLADYRKGVELNYDMFCLVDEECRKKEIPWFVSVLDWNSYKFMLQFNVPILKLPSTISNHKNYLRKVGEDFRGDLVISTGFTDSDYESFVLNNFSRNRNLFLLQCTSSYPTPPEACQISVVRHYDQLASTSFSNVLPGYSSHDVGSLGCMLAVSAGAKMVEKHVKLGDLEWIHFDGVAIDLYSDKFKNFVRDIRKAELMCGSKKKKIHSFEHHKYQTNEKAN